MSAKTPKQEVRQPPQLYVVTPPVADAVTLAAALTEALDAHACAAVLLRLAGGDERTQINCAKAIGKLVQPRDAALILDGMPELTARAGADGAHLTGIAAFQDAASLLKPDRIAGAGGLESRHDAMLAAEGNADYVMFGEPDESGQRPSLDAIIDRVAWWAEVFQTPCVAYAGHADEIEPLVRAGVDFVALDPAIWLANPRGAITDVLTRLRLPESVA